MKIASLISVSLTTALATLNLASGWWERALATHVDSEISPDGCLRLESYIPFWVLPSIFHNMPSPGAENGYGFTWGGPGFYRLFEMSSGEFLGESIVFDKALAGDDIYWGSWNKKRQRSVTVGGFLVAQTDKCNDRKAQETLLEYMHEQGALRRAEAEAAQARYRGSSKGDAPNGMDGG